MGAHPLYLVGVDVWRGILDRGGKVEDDRLVAGRRPEVGDRLTDLQGESEFGAGKAFRRVFELNARACRDEGRHGLLEEGDGLRGDAGDVGAAGVEDVFALLGRGRVVEVEDDVGRTAQGLQRTRDKVLPARAENLDGDVGGDAFLTDEPPAKIEFDLGGGGKAYLDFLEADFHEQVEELEFLVDAHGLGESLVAIAEVDGTPDGGTAQRAIGPLAVRQEDRWERTVF